MDICDIIFSIKSSKSGVRFMYRTSQIGLATFPVLSSHMGLDYLIEEHSLRKCKQYNFLFIPPLKKAQLNVEPQRQARE